MFRGKRSLRLRASTIDWLYFGGGRVGAGSVTEIQVTRRGEIPDEIPGEATAVMLNVTAVNPTAAGYLTVFACGIDIPNASNVNYQSGQIVSNMVFAEVDLSGKVCVFSTAATDLVIDVNGYNVT